MSKIAMFLEHGNTLLKRVDGSTDGLCVGSFIIDGIVDAFSGDIIDNCGCSYETLRAVAVLRKHAADDIISIPYEGVIRGEGINDLCKAVCSKPEKLFGDKAEYIAKYSDCRVIVVIYNGDLQPQV